MLSVIFQFLSGDYELTDLLMQVFAFAVVIIICFPIHESAHAWAAHRLGDDTGRLSGRITMNPMAHLSLMGTICIALFGFGYAKPVPVNIRNFPYDKRKKYFALVAIAGPASNLLIAVASILFSNAFYAIYVLRSLVFCDIASTLFSTIAYINIALMIFNLIPCPPLDGSRIWTMLLPDRLYYKFLSYERYIMYGLLALIFLFNRINFSPVSIITGFVYNGLNAVLWLPFNALLGLLY